MARTNIESVELTTSLVTKHTVASNVQATLIELWFNNSDTVNRLVTVHFVPSGDTATDANKVLEMQSGNALRPGELQGYEWAVHLDTDDFIQVKADAASVVAMYGGILEEAL